MKRALFALILGVPLVMVLAFGFGRDPNVVASPLLNKPAPSFALRTVDGKAVSLGSLRGHPVVLNFWASWCVACKDEHPYLLQIWRSYEPRGVRLVGVAFHDTAPGVHAYMNQYGGAWPTLQDPNQATAINYGVSGPPETFFIDPNGVIRYKSTGPLSAEAVSRGMREILGNSS